MKVLLFWPGVGGGYPLSIPLLQSVIKAKGHEAMVFDATVYHHSPRSTRGMLFKSSDAKDAKLDEKKFTADMARGSAAFSAAVDKFKPDVIAMSAFSTNFLIGLSYYGSLRASRKIFFLAGGVHPTLVPDETIGYPEVDAICVGEGEDMVVDFLARCEEGALLTKEFSGIDNLWYKDPSGRIIKNMTGRVTDLETAPLPDISGFGVQEATFVGKKYKLLPFQLSRGCPLHCAFCCNDAYKRKLFGKALPVIRRMAPETAVKGMLALQGRHHIEIFKLIDENFMAAPLSWLTDFCLAYRSRINLPFFISASAGLVTEEKVRLIKEAGCISVNMGPESGNEEYRKNILKKAEPDSAYIKARRIFEDYDIRVNANILFGLPFQRDEIIQDTIRFIRKLNCPISTEIFVPLPGSELYDKIVAMGYKGFKTAYDCYRSFAEPVYIPEGMTREKIIGLSRTLILYAKLPESLWPVIKQCEPKTKEADRILDMLDLIFAN